MLRRYSLQTSTYPCCLVCTCFLGGRITPGPNGLRLLSAFPPGRRDGRKRPFVRPVNRTAERRWKAAPILPSSPRRPIHNVRGLIKYSSGKIVDYAAVATIAVAVLPPPPPTPPLAPSLLQWKESCLSHSLIHSRESKERRCVTTGDGNKGAWAQKEHPNSKMETPNFSMTSTESDPYSKFRKFLLPLRVAGRNFCDCLGHLPARNGR